MIKAIIILLLGAAAYAETDAQELDKSLGSRMNGGEGYDSGVLIDNWKGNLGNNVSPLMNNIPMFTLDSQSSFDAQLLCSAEKELVSVTYSTSAKGDIDMTVKLDGQSSRSFYGISAICKDGLKICTGSVCGSYKFLITMFGQVDLNPVKELSECRCINESCGKSGGVSEYGELSQQLTDLMKSNNMYHAVSGTLTEPTHNGAIFKVFSKDSRVCLSANTEFDDYGSSSPAANYNPSVIPDGSAEMTKQLNNDDSLLSLINKSDSIEYEDGVTAGKPSVNRCTIINTIGGAGEIFTTDGGCEMSPSICGKVIEDYSGDYSACVFERKASICGTYDIVVTTGYKNIEYSLSVDGELSEQKTCADNILGLDYKGRQTQRGKLTPVELSINQCYGSPSVVSSITGYFMRSSKLALTSSDTCKANNAGCKILSERVCNKGGSGCIVTVDNFNTVMRAEKACITEEINGITFKICADGDRFTAEHAGAGVQEFAARDAYFHIEREYSCPPKDSGLKSEKTDIKNIYDNMGIRGDETIAGVDGCFAPSCSVITKTHDTELFDDGTNRVSIGNSETEIVVIRQCAKERDNTFKCVLNPNEAIKADCSCSSDKMLDEIGKTLGVLEAVKFMGANKICSQK